MLETIAKFIVGPLVALMTFAGYTVEAPQAQLGATLPISGQTYTLAGSGVSAAATSITLSSLTLPQTGYEIQDSDLSATFYVTLEPGNRTKQEIVSCTTVTQNANDTATLSGCSRGLLPISPYTASSTYAFPHGGGTSVIFSNPPQLYNQFAAKDNDEIITGTWTFNNFPITASTTYASESITGSVRLATGLEAASSTEGASTSRRVIPTTISTSTAPASGHVVPVTGIDGNLDVGFLPAFSSYASLASSTAAGVVEEATSAQIASSTAVGETGARLFINPSTLPFKGVFTHGTTTYDLSTPSGTQTIAHGLSATPTKIRIIGVAQTDGASIRASYSETIYTTTQSSTFLFISTGSTIVGNSFRLHLSSGAYQSGIITVDSTNITITWTKTGIPTGTANLMWEAEI